MATFTPTRTTTPTQAPSPTATAIRTPPGLPGIFQTALLKPSDLPHTYISEPCQYIQDKWSSTNSPPGTVAIAIMFHSIMTAGDNVGSNQITQVQFNELMGKLKQDGFEAITTLQLADFMEHNARIPSRSVILIVDDRHFAEYFNQYFRPFWESKHWPVVNAWISTPLSSADLWRQQEELDAEGWVDYQAHGVVHNEPMWPGVTDSYIMNELQGSIDAFKLHFNKVPTAIIWPGGGFSLRSVQIARQLGYRLGFTTNARGPLMFNWVPLADDVTPLHGEWQPEGEMNDPLMVLPRYWDTDAIIHLDDVIRMSQAATAYAGQNKATELEYYDIVCAPRLGPIP